MDCRNLGLTRVPTDIPHDTVELWEKIYLDKNKPSSKNISPSSGDLRIIRSLRLGRMHFRRQSNWRECKSWANEWDFSRGGRSITFDEREQISAVRFLCWNYFNSVLFLEICHETSWGMSRPRPSPIIRSSPLCKCSTQLRFERLSWVLTETRVGCAELYKAE